MLSFKHEGAFDKTKKFLENAKETRNLRVRAQLDSIAQQGVQALSQATPVRSGKTANSWSYEIEEKNGKIVIAWVNDNNVNGVNIAIILQYGHGTRTGGHVAGIDYINPALRSIFTKMSDI